MKILDKIGLIVFANLILIISIIICLLIFGWINVEGISFVLELALNDSVTTNVFLGISIVLILLAIKCIFFTYEDKKVNGVKDGILLKNDDGSLVISKSTLEELANSVARGFESAQNVESKIVLDEERNIIVNIILTVKETAVIKELSTNIQNKVKAAIKKTSDLEVKEVNISVRELQADKKKIEEQI